MELDKESTESGSHGLNSDLDSPPTSGNDDIDVPFGEVGVVDETTDLVEKEAVEEGNSAVEIGGESLSGKKKRGRPRKYDQSGNLTAAYLNRSRSPAIPGFTLSTPPSYGYPSSGGKRGRGRGFSGSGGNWQALASFGDPFATSAGCDFTPHIVTVQIGEDVAGKIITFAQQGPRGICVLSANGSVSNVMLRQPGSSGGLLTYEGRFEILTLTGAYTIHDNGGMKSRSGGLSVSLASSDGRVIGGVVAGVLMAASPIQIVLGSFTPHGGAVVVKPKRKRPIITPQSAPPLTVTAAVPISQAAPEHTGGIFKVQPVMLQVQPERSNDACDWNAAASHDQRPPPPSDNI